MIEKALSTYLQKTIEIVGCGRTDTGVHAKNYFAHFDVNYELMDIPLLLYRINKMLPGDICFHDIIKVQSDAHARFDAVQRSYEYHLHTVKSPFLTHSYFYPFGISDIGILNDAAAIILEYGDFSTFCKTRTDVKTMDCKVSESFWYQNGNQFIYKITADRFLRGMIRLIVGMSLNISKGKLSTDEVRKAIEEKRRTGHDWSAPAIGLFLCNIRYPYI